MKWLQSLSYYSRWVFGEGETTSEQREEVEAAVVFLVFMALLSALFIAANHGELC
jgi:hypothetical protein